MPLYWRINGVEGGGVEGGGVGGDAAEGSDDMSESLIIPRFATIGVIPPVQPSITIQVFEKSDLPGILRIEREAFPLDAWPRQTFIEYAAAVPDLFLVAKVAESVSGYSIGTLTHHGAEIASLAVGARHRQMGVATALLQAMFPKLRRSGAQAVFLMVRRQNEGAIRLYRKLGFVRTGTVRNHYADGTPAWRMRMSLGE
jgi:[ribosomal protein S18]-alanine N-acetyltransferase